MFGLPGHVELLIVAAIFFLLFGNRLPGALKSLGQGLRVFRDEMRPQED